MNIPEENSEQISNDFQKGFTPTEKEGGWEELKDIIFPIIEGYYGEGETYTKVDKYSAEKFDEIKSFIRKTLAHFKDNLNEHIEEIKCIDSLTKNEALDLVITLINKDKEIR